MSVAPEIAGGLRLWRDRWCCRGQVEVLFVGRGLSGSRREVLAAAAPTAPALAWAKQIHSARVLAAGEGFCGEGDALVTDRPGLALSVVTADCVPVLIAGGRGIAAVHAGWRGIAAGVVGETLERLPGTPAVAWIGPAIGPCCYEVGEEVAEQVVRASHPGVARPGPAGRPHLDLAAAVRHQLEAAGLPEVRTLRACTRCLTEELWSYRRDGAKAGRNMAFIWRLGNAASPTLDSPPGSVL